VPEVEGVEVECCLLGVSGFLRARLEEWCGCLGLNGCGRTEDYERCDAVGQREVFV